MIKIEIVAVGRMTDTYLKAFQDYERRMKWSVSVRQIEVKVKKNNSAAQKIECEKILDTLDPQAFKIMMDERGKTIKSLEFSEVFDRQIQSGQTKIQCIIGGADGLTEDVRSKANFLLSFGKQTWPHQLARVMLMEQLYRAQQILQGHPYHRE
jgi:23S rRNA (pseudouridine1915-N3)-methyltransferase